MEKEKKIYDETKFEQHLSTNPALQEALEKKFQSEEFNYTQANNRSK